MIITKNSNGNTVVIIVSSISSLSKGKYIQMKYYLKFQIVNCYKEKLKLYFTGIGIWIAAVVENRNGKWMK